MLHKCEVGMKWVKIRGRGKFSVHKSVTYMFLLFWRSVTSAQGQLVMRVSPEM